MNSVAVIWLSRDTSAMAAGLSALSQGACADSYASVNGYEGDEATLGTLLNEAYRRLVPLAAADPTMHCVAVAPLWDNSMEERLETLRSAVAASRDSVSVHVLALSRNLAKVCGVSLPEINVEADYESMRRIAENAGGGHRFTCSLIEDYAANGAAFNFTLASLGDYVRTFVRALIQDYDAVFPPAVVIGGDENNYGIGVSAVRFDRDDAVEYLLHRAFVSKLDAHGVSDERVDAQMAMNRAQTILKGAASRYAGFYRNKVMPLFREDKLSEEEVVARASGLLEQEMGDIERELTACVHDDSLSFPEKEAVLSLVLGRDNSRLSGAQYESDTVVADDLVAEAADLYIGTFNELCPESGLLPVRGDYPELKLYYRDPVTDKVEESAENERAFNPLRKIKELKQQICNNTEFLRRKTAELESLRRAESRSEIIRSQKEGDDTVRRMPDAEVREQPLDDSYTPPAGFKPLPSVDLRQYFSPVKSQGTIGSCTAFAVTAIYESIMNRAAGEGSAQADMSERFLFYWSNVVTGHPEGGSSYHDQLGVAGKHGLCREASYPYTTVGLNEAPGEEAVNEASSHRVLKALQIPLRSEGNLMDCVEHNHRLMTSALSQGYPVGIGLKVFDSFQRKGAFINRPDDDDRSSGGEGNHALVLVGYSEKEKCYIVRNSWGKDWGDKGYAYVSAAYIDDPEYNHFACVVTETTERAGSVRVPELVANFGGTETEIRMASIRNVLDEVRMQMEDQKRQYREYYRYYSDLLARMSLPATQSELRKVAEDDSRRGLLSVRSRLTRLREDYMPSLRAFKRNYVKFGVYPTGAVLLFVLLTAFTGLRQYVWSWIVSGVAVLVCVTYWVNYYWAWRRRRRELQEAMDETSMRERRAERDLLEKQLQYHLAGMWMSAFHELATRLNTTLDRLESFNDKLREWHAEDMAALARPARHEGQMFFYLGDTRLYDRYFADNIGVITADIDLMRVFDSYRVSSRSMTEARAELDRETRRAIGGLFSDFSMMDFLLGREYPYIESVVLSDEMKKLIISGQPSLRFDLADAMPPSHPIFVQADEGKLSALRRAITPYFSYTPQVEPAISDTSLTLLTVQPLPVSAIRR